MEIIERIKLIRKNKKISRKKIADYLNISNQTYRDIESGKIKLKLETYIKICKFLNINHIDLLREHKEDHFVLMTEKEIDFLNQLVNNINKQII